MTTPVITATTTVISTRPTSTTDTAASVAAAFNFF